MKRALAVATFTLAALAAFPAEARLAVKGSPSIDFYATGPGGLNIDGKTSDMTVDDSKSLTFTVPLKNVTTGIAVRDEHMKDKYLEVAKYPDAKLEIARDQIKVPEVGKRTDGEAPGKFTVHGKTHDVKVKWKAHRAKDGVIDTEGKLGINLKDYDIAIPNYLGVTVRPDIDIQVKFQATDE